MKRLSVLLFASAVLFGMASCQAMDDPMEVELTDPSVPTAPQAANPSEQQVLRSGPVTEAGGDFFAGLQ